MKEEVLPGRETDMRISPFLSLVSNRSNFWASYLFFPASSCSELEYCNGQKHVSRKIDKQLICKKKKSRRV